MRILRHSLLNGWPLFFLIAAFSTAIMAVGYSIYGVATPEATVDMIRLSVKVATPWIFLTFAVSSLAQLFPGQFTKWMLRNRRYLGLSFAAGMGWQLVFIAVLFASHAWYYWEVLHKPEDLILRIASYGVLFALTITSFYPIRRQMNPRHWRWLHLLGVWYLWAAIWFSYLGIALGSEGEERITISSISYAMAGFLALYFRLIAWWQRRSQAS